MRQRTKNHRNQGSIDKKIRFFSKFLRHISRWVRFVQKTRSKNSHAWAPLSSLCNSKSANFLGVPVRKSANFHELSANRKSVNFYKILLKSVLKQSYRSYFYMFFCFVLWIRQFYALFVGRKVKYLRTCGSFKSANIKKSTNRKFAKCQICERTANNKL